MRKYVTVSRGIDKFSLRINERKLKVSGVRSGVLYSPWRKKNLWFKKKFPVAGNFACLNAFWSEWNQAIYWYSAKRSHWIKSDPIMSPSPYSNFLTFSIFFPPSLRTGWDWRLQVQSGENFQPFRIAHLNSNLYTWWWLYYAYRRHDDFHKMPVKFVSTNRLSLLFLCFMGLFITNKRFSFHFTSSTDCKEGEQRVPIGATCFPTSWVS